MHSIRFLSFFGWLWQYGVHGSGSWLGRQCYEDLEVGWSAFHTIVPVLGLVGCADAGGPVGGLDWFLLWSAVLIWWCMFRQLAFHLRQARPVGAGSGLPLPGVQCCMPRLTSPVQHAQLSPPRRPLQNRPSCRCLEWTAASWGPWTCRMRWA